MKKDTKEVNTTTVEKEVNTEKKDAVDAIQKQLDAVCAQVRKLTDWAEKCHGVDINGDGKIGVFGLILAVGLFCVSGVGAVEIEDFESAIYTNGQANIQYDSTEGYTLVIDTISGKVANASTEAPGTTYTIELQESTNTALGSVVQKSATGVDEVEDNMILTNVGLHAYNDATQLIDYAGTKYHAVDVTDGTEDGRKSVWAYVNGTNTLVVDFDGSGADLRGELDTDTLEVSGASTLDNVTANDIVSTGDVTATTFVLDAVVIETLTVGSAGTNSASHGLILNVDGTNYILNARPN